MRLASRLSVAGTSASRSVFSPSDAPPRAMIPAIAARSIAMTSSPVSSVLSPAATPARRNAVPQIGPLTPPTLAEIVRPIFLSSDPTLGSVERVVVAEDDLEPVAERVAEVAVADDRVELRRNRPRCRRSSGPSSSGRDRHRRATTLSCGPPFWGGCPRPRPGYEARQASRSASVTKSPGPRGAAVGDHARLLAVRVAERATRPGPPRCCPPPPCSR